MFRKPIVGFLIICLAFFFSLPDSLFAQTCSHLVINEVFYNTPGTESREEWIELYNPTNKKIDLENWKIVDLSAKEYILPKIEIASKGFLTLARDKQGFFDLYGFNPDLSDFSLTLNNSGETLSLFDPSKSLVDLMAWEGVDQTLKPHPGTKEGQSLERQPKGQDINDSAKDFIVQDDPTPGLGLFIGPEITKVIGQENKLEISWQWLETDKKDFDRLEVYLTEGIDFSQTPDRVFLTFPSSPLLATGLEWATEYRVKMAIVKKYGSREITSWSDVIIASTEYDLSDEILINELYPAPPMGGAEFIELFNGSNRAVNLKGWYLADQVEEYRISTELIIHPKQYLALYNTGLTLNNTGDTIRLRYPDHSVADKTKYASAKQKTSWSKRGKSFFWTPLITPNKKNQFPKNMILKPIKIKKVLKQKKETMVITKGQVSVPPPVFGKQMIYIQDNTAGIQLYFYHHKWPKLKLGTWVRVFGEISSVRGEKRIKLKEKKDIRRIKEGGMKAKTIGWDRLDSNIGRLITISGTVSSSSGSTFYLAQGNTELKIYIKESTKIDKPTTRKGYQATITGVLIKTDQGLKLLPRYQEDLKISAISQITDYGKVIEESEGPVAGEGSKVSILQTSQPTDYRPDYLIDQTKELALPRKKAGQGATTGAGLALAGFLAFLYRLPLLELITRLKG